MTTHQLDLANKVLQITLPGDLLSTNYDAVGEQIQAIMSLEEIKKADWATLILDMREARLIDSMGLNLIVGLVRQVKGRDAQIKTLICSRTIYRTFLFTRLEKHMEIVFEEKPPAAV